MRIPPILIGIALVYPSRNAHADGTAILIAGNAPRHVRELSRSAMKASFEAQGRTIVDAVFTAKEKTFIQTCISNAANAPPWSCMEATVAPKGIDQLVVGSVDAEKSSPGELVVRLSGHLVASSLDIAISEERRCTPCSDDLLENVAGGLAQVQLRRLAVAHGRTKIAVRTIPHRALITFDGEARGLSDTVITTYPGSHTVRLELGGHRVETRTVEVVDGQTAEISVAMQPNDEENPPHPRPSRLVPILIGSAGLAAVITGGALIAAHAPPGPPEREPVRHEYYYSTRTPGIVTAISGAAAIGVSIYLWRRRSRSSVIAAPLSRDGGVAASWMTTF